jgi:valyl-tRNA synthetase
VPQPTARPSSGSRGSTASISAGRRAGAVQIVLDEATLALPLAGIIDIGAESQRLKREIDKVGSEIKQLDAKLANEKFVKPSARACGRGAARAVRPRLRRPPPSSEQALKRLEAAF